MVKSRHTKPKKPSTRSVQTDALHVLHKDMQDLLELQRAQETKFVSEVKDVPRVRINKNSIYNVELSYVQTVALNSMAPNFGALNFQLNNASNYVSFTGAFDQYRLLQVNVKIIPIGVAVGGGNTLYTVLDYDDATVPNSPATYLGYSTLKITPSGVIDERTLNPRAAAAVYAGGAFNGYANVGQRQWMDSASPNVQYYGLKYYTPQAAVSASIQFVITLTVQFRSQRAS